MADAPSKQTLKLLVGVLIGCSITMIAGAVWMIATDRGSPVYVAIGGSLLASFAAILAAQGKKKG